MKHLFVVCGLSALLLSSCVHSPDLNTPREVVLDKGVAGTVVTALVTYNGVPQTLQIVDNLLVCNVQEGAGGMTVSLRMELQNTAPPASDYLNSVYLRADALPVDDKEYSLSGDPTSAQSRAAKFMVWNTVLSSFVSVVPDQTTGRDNNFVVRLRKALNERQIIGTLSCSTTVNGNPVTVSGVLSIVY